MLTYLISFVVSFIILRILMRVLGISYDNRKIIIMGIAAAFTYFVTLGVTIVKYKSYPIVTDIDTSYYQPHLHTSIKRIDTSYAFKENGDTVLAFDTTYNKTLIMYFTDSLGVTEVGFYDEDYDLNKWKIIKGDTLFSDGIQIKIDTTISFPVTLRHTKNYDVNPLWIMPLMAPDITSYLVLFIPKSCSYESYNKN